MKRYVMLLAVMSLLMVALAVPAFAQGKSEQGVDTARSICAYSGLNDEPEVDGRVQSYGQIVKQGGKEFVPSPGDACNPTKPPPEEPA